MCAMTRSHPARHHAGQAPAAGQAIWLGRAVARQLRAGVAVAAAGLCAVLPALAERANAQPAAQAPQATRATRAVAAQAATAATAATGRSVTAPLAVTVTSVSPSYVQEGHAVTISGLVRNLSGATASGLSVGLLASATPLRSRLALANFAAGTETLPQTLVSIRNPTMQTLGAGRSWRWRVSLPASSLGLSCFGVYPLTAKVTAAALQAASDPVPLPYWPAKPTSCAGQTRPRPFPISWIWPLIDAPHQDACAGLTDDRLAGSIAPKGRLGYLLAIGARYAASAELTWAIDPALLDSVRAMKQPYPVGAPATCRPGTEHAAGWLAGLRKTTAGHPVFVTPYADVDVAALVRRGDTADLRRSLAEGDQAAHQILGRGLVPAPLPAGRGNLSAVAWPPGGTASGGLLNYFANPEEANVSAVVLAAPPASPVSYTPGAVTSLLTGTGKRLHILLADRPITALLRSGLASSRSPGARFSVSQLYLAQTAMIAAEAPGSPRPIVVAPPRRWDPTRSLASDLLAETVHTPWLKPSTAGQLAAMKPEYVYKRISQYEPAGQHSARLLRSVSKLDHEIALLQSIRVTRDPELDRAVSGIESSAWSGKAAKQATAMLARTWRYVDSQLRGVSIGGGGKHATYHVTFGGKSSAVTVVIHNKLRYQVSVGLLVRASKAQVTGVPAAITIPALGSSSVKLPVHVTADQGRIRLSLVAPKYSRLAGHPLPAYPLVILVHPTEFGTFALAIVAVALAVFVIASAFRAIRHGRPAPPGGPVPDATAPPAHDQPPGLSEPPAPGTDPPVQAHPAESAGPGSPPSRAAQPGAASGTPGETAIPRRGFGDLGNRPEHTDSVGHDRSELTSAGPAATDQEPAAPSRRATEERR